MKHFILVCIGGGLGSGLRFIISKVLSSDKNYIPYHTLSVNIIGSLIIGFVIGYFVKENNTSTTAMMLLSTGFCGGFTTFSSFAFENFTFLKNGDFIPLITYTTISLLVGLLATFLGFSIAKYV